MSHAPPASTTSKGTGVKKSAAKKLKSTAARSKSSVDEQEKPHGSLAQIGLVQAGAVHAPTQPPAENDRKVQEAVVQEWTEEAVEIEDKSGVEQATSALLSEPGPLPATNDQQTRDVYDVIALWTKPALAHLEPGSLAAESDEDIQEDTIGVAVTETFGKLKFTGVLQDTLRAIDVDVWEEQCPWGHKLKELLSHHRWHNCSVCMRFVKKGEKIRWCVLCQWSIGRSQFVLCKHCTPRSPKRRQRSRRILEARLLAQELLKASEKFDMSTVWQLLAWRADPRCKVIVDEDGDQRVSSCLHAAAKAGFAEAIRVFLRCDANPKVKDDDGRSPLHAAVLGGNLDAIRELVHGLADVNAQDSFGQCPIHFAACHRGPEAQELVRGLLAAYADANVEDLAGRVAFELAGEDNPKILEVSMMSDDARYDPLREAKKKMALVVRRVVDRVWNAYRRYPEIKQHNQQLCLACARGDVETVRSLLERRAEVGFRAPGWDLHVEDVRDTAPILGWTPLHAAIEREALDIVKMLLEAQADVNTPECSFDQLLPIHRAARSGNVPVLCALASARADVSVETWTKKLTPLHLAAKRGCTEVAKTLVELKAHVHDTNIGGYTALHFAAAYGHADTVEALLASKADPLIKDVKDQVAWNLAMSEGNVDAAKRLFGAGSQVVDMSADLVPYYWAAMINRHDGLVTAIVYKTGTVVLHDQDVAPRLRATFCTISPRTLLVQVPEHIDSDVEAPLLIPTPEGLAFPFWSTLTRPSLTSKGRLVQLDLGCDPTHQAIIRAFASTPNDVAYSLSVSIALLEHAWGGVEVWYYFEVLWCFAVLACACIVAKALNEEREAPDRELLVLRIGIAKRAVDEVAQLLDVAVENVRRNSWIIQAPAILYGDVTKNVKPVNVFEAFAYATFTHIGNPMNQVDIGCLILDTAAIIAAVNFRGTQLQTGLIGVSGATMWLRALYLLRGSRKFGTRLLPILSAVKDTLTFFVVMAFVIAAVTHYYYLTGGAGTGLFPAFEKVYRLCLWADFDILDWQGLNPGFVMVNDTVNGLEWVPEDPPHTDMYLLLQFLFYATTICVTVIFMNLLIAILNENFSEYETRGSTLFQRERAKLIIMLRCCSVRLALMLPYRGLELLVGGARAVAKKLGWLSGEEAGWAYCFYLACLLFPSGMMRYHYKYWDSDTKPKLVFLQKAEEGDVDTTGEIRSTRFFLHQQMTVTEKRISQQLRDHREQLKEQREQLWAVLQEVAAVRNLLEHGSGRQTVM